MSSEKRERPHAASSRLRLSSEPVDLPSGWILLLPSVTIGNIGQLAIDLFLATLPAEHVGHLSSAELLPFVAASPHCPAHKSSIIVGMEVYHLQCSHRDVFVIQQRSPPAMGRAASHAHSIIAWALDNGCSEILHLSSANAAGMRGAQLRSALDGQRSWRNIRVAVTSAALAAQTLATRATQDLNWSVLENADGDSRGWSSHCSNNVQMDRMEKECIVPAFLPSSRKGSFVRTLLEECERLGVSLTTVVQFVHEGDNIGDALVMASAAAILLKLIPFRGEGSYGSTGRLDPAGSDSVPFLNEVLSGWKVPSSWCENLTPPLGLY